MRWRIIGVICVNAMIVLLWVTSELEDVDKWR